MNDIYKNDYQKLLFLSKHPVQASLKYTISLNKNCSFWVYCDSTQKPRKLNK